MGQVKKKINFPTPVGGFVAGIALNKNYDGTF